MVLNAIIVKNIMQLLQSYSQESQRKKYLYTRGHGQPGKVSEFENFCIKSQGKSEKKIPVENEVSRSTFGLQKCFL